MSQNNKNVFFNTAMPSMTLYVDNDNFDGFFTDEERQLINMEIDHYETLQSIVIEVLKIVQKRKGWLEDCDIVSVARFLKIPVSEVEGVATFYNQIFRQPVGKYVIRICDSMVCYINGCQGLRLACESILKIKQGESSLDNRFTLLPVSCLGKCDESPVVMINQDIHSRMSPNNIKKILEQYQ